MKNKLVLILIAAGLEVVALPAVGETPVIVENMLPKAKHYRQDFSLNYSNNRYVTATSSQLIPLPIAPNEYILVSGPVSQYESNTDVLLFSAGLRYGLSENTQWQIRASGYASQSRSSGPNGVQENSDSSFSTLSAGMTQRFFGGKSGYNLLGYANINLLQRVKSPGGYSTLIYGKAFFAGLNTYWTSDPVVLSFNAVAGVSLPYELGGTNIRSGNTFVLSPAINFAANDQVTLTWGAQWQYQGANGINGKANSTARTQTGLNMGLGYATSYNWTYLGNVNLLATDGGSSSISINATRSF